MPGPGIVKVNLGAGLSVAAEWINIDSNSYALISKLPSFVIKILYRISSIKEHYTGKEFVELLKKNVFIAHNLGYGIPLPDESVDFLYSSHLIEHLFREEAARLLKEIYRVLKKGGRIRICVPDLEYAITLYHKGKKTRALSYFFTENFDDRFNDHRYMYDYDLLKSLLTEAGFTGIEKNNYRQGKVPDIDVLDNRPDETLFVESVK